MVDVVRHATEVGYSLRKTNERKRIFLAPGAARRSEVGVQCAAAVGALAPLDLWFPEATRALCPCAALHAPISLGAPCPDRLSDRCRELMCGSSDVRLLSAGNRPRALLALAAAASPTPPSLPPLGPLAAAAAPRFGPPKHPPQSLRRGASSAPVHSGLTSKDDRCLNTLSRRPGPVLVGESAGDTRLSPFAVGPRPRAAAARGCPPPPAQAAAAAQTPGPPTMGRAEGGGGPAPTGRVVSVGSVTGTPSCPLRTSAGWRLVLAASGCGCLSPRRKSNRAAPFAARAPEVGVGKK